MYAGRPLYVAPTRTIFGQLCPLKSSLEIAFGHATIAIGRLAGVHACY